MRHGDLFYRGSVLSNLLPVEEATKAGSLSTLPSLKRSLGPSELSLINHLEHKVPARTTTRLVSLALITSEFDCKERIKKGIVVKKTFGATFGGGLMESITMQTQPQVSVKPMLQIMVLLMTLRQHLMKIRE